MAANVYLLCVLPCLSLSVSLSPLSSEVHCLLSSVEVEMIGQWRSLDWWERTPGMLLRLVLQSHFIFIAEQGARVVDVFVLGQLFGTARRCARYFICPVEEGVVHLKKTQNWLQYDVYLLYNRNSVDIWCNWKLVLDPFEAQQGGEGWSEPRFWNTRTWRGIKSFWFLFIDVIIWVFFLWSL